MSKYLQKKQRQKFFYTEVFKQKNVNEVVGGKYNKYQSSPMYGIKGNATILYRICQSQRLAIIASNYQPFANFAEMIKNITDKKL